MTTLEHIYAIKNIINRGIASDDSRISNRLILHFMNISRGMLLEQKLDKYISMQDFQSLCIDLAGGSYHNCCDIKIPTDCTILKSTIKLPQLLSARWGSFIKVTTLDGTILGETNITQSKNAKYSLTNNSPKTGWFIHDDYLYVINNTKLKKLLINGLWSNPESIAKYNCPDNQPCFSDLTEYPISPDLIPAMYQMVLKFISTSYSFPEDNVSDASASGVSNQPSNEHKS